MKIILRFLGIITLIGTSTTSLVACNTTKYNETELKKLKEKNKISINDDTLEWIAPQEKPFNKFDNKWYFVIWRVNKNDNWRIVKIKNNNLKKIVFDKYNEYDLKLWEEEDLIIYENKFPYRGWSWDLDDDGTRFKSVYCWDGIGEPNILNINSKTGKITNLNNIK